MEQDPRSYANSFNNAPMPSIDSGMNNPQAAKFLNTMERIARMEKAGISNDDSPPPAGLTQSPFDNTPSASAITPRTAPSVTVEDHQIPLSLGCSIPGPEDREFQFTVHFKARQVNIEDDSISVFMNDVLSLTLPKLHVAMRLSVNGITYNVIYAGATMKVGPYRVISFLVVE